MISNKFDIILFFPSFLAFLSLQNINENNTNLPINYTEEKEGEERKRGKCINKINVQIRLHRICHKKYYRQSFLIIDKEVPDCVQSHEHSTKRKRKKKDIYTSINKY